LSLLYNYTVILYYSSTERQASRYGGGPLPDIVDYRPFDCQTTVCQDGEMFLVRWNAVLGLPRVLFELLFF